MGKASISIAITSNFSSRGIDAAIRKMEQLNAQAISLHGQFGKSAIDAGAQLGQLGARLQTIGNQIASFGDKLTMGITLPVGIAATATTLAAAQIDTAWYNVRKTVDMTEEGYQRLKEGAIALSDVQPVSAETLLNIEALGGQLGITNKSLEDFARIVSGLEIATNLTSDQAATALAQIRNITQMAEDDMDNFASAVVDLGNHTATTEKDILNLSLKFASAGHVAGMSNQEILGLSAALAGLGMKAEAGGSALSQVINKISLAVSEGGEDLQGWADLVGKSADEFASAWRNAPADEFLEVLQAIGADGADANKILSDLEITQIRQSDAMRRLASSGDLVKDSIERANNAWKENTALTREVENRNESIAAQFQVIWNRIVNTAAQFGDTVADMLIGTLDALDPLINGLRDIANAFQEADPVTKRFIANLVGIGVAVGPVLSVFGRLTSGFGGLLTWIGRMTQQWGRFKEALHTTDAAMLQTLSTQDTWAVKLGLSNNEIVKAAGGLDKYRAAVVPYVSQVRKQAEATERATIAEEARIAVENKGYTSKRKINKEINSIIHSEQSRTRVTKAGTKAVDGLTKADLVNAAANKQVGETAVGAATGLTALKSAFAGLGLMAAAGIALAGITWLISKYQEAQERAEALGKATSGLRNALGATDVSLDSTAESAEDMGLSFSSAIEHVDKAIEKQGELAETFRENQIEADASIGSLNRAWAAIKEYANNSDLSASQQYRLESAIATVNEQLGTQYQLTDGNRVVIEGENGAIQVSTDEIYRNIEARKKQIQLQAIESNYEESYKQHLETTKAYSDAQKTLNDTWAEFVGLRDKYKNTGESLTIEESRRMHELYDQIGPLTESVKSAAEAMGASGDSIRYWERQLDSAAGKAEELDDSLSSLLQNDLDFSTAFMANEKDLNAGLDVFSKVVDEIGINFAALQGLSAEAANQVAMNFDGSARSIVEALEEVGPEASYILRNIGNDWIETFSSATQNAIFQVTSMGEYTAAEMRALAEDLGVSGEQAIRAFAEGLERGYSPEDAASIARQFDDAFADSLTPDQASAAAEAYWQAILDGLSPEEAQSKAQEVIDNFQSTLNGASFDGTEAGTKFADTFITSTQSSIAGYSPIVSDTGRVVGYALADGTRMGIEEGGTGVPTAIQNMVDGGQEPLASLIPLAYDNGLQVGPNYAQGISDGGGDINPVVSDLWGSVVSDLQQGIPGAEGAGEDTGAGYSNKIASQQDPAVRAAKDTQIGVIEAYIIGILAAKIAGETIGARFAGGIASKMSVARDAAQAVANMAVRSLNTGGQYAYNSGVNLGNNFAAGISASSSRIAAAASNAAAAASRFLHHSTPEAGPLKDDDVWGYHFAQNLADGMRKGTPLIARQANAIAQSMAAGDYQSIAESTSRAAIARYGSYGTSWQGYPTRGEAAAQAVTQAANAPMLTRDDIKAAVAEAMAEAVPPEIAMYVSGSKLASTIAGDMDYALGQLDARR